MFLRRCSQLFDRCVERNGELLHQPVDMSRFDLGDDVGVKACSSDTVR